jgi:PIN domain nuclease of toxin-antitoxin system
MSIICRTNRGSETVEKALPEACISAVNWSEVVQKSIAADVKTEGMREDLEVLGLSFLDFTAPQAESAARLWEHTSRFGLSFADRACLSLGITLNLPVLTADKDWQKPKLPLEVNLIR